RCDSAETTHGQRHWPRPYANARLAACRCQGTMKMRFRTVARVVMTAALMLVPITPAVAQSAQAPAAQEIISNEDLLRVTALDEVFTHFGAGIEQAPQEQGIPFTAAMQAAWTAAAREVFNAGQMQRRLA